MNAKGETQNAKVPNRNNPAPACLVFVLPFAFFLFPSAFGADPAAARAAYDRGLRQLAARENEAAVKSFTAALAADPDLAAAHDRRGDAYLKLGRFKEAV